MALNINGTTGISGVDGSVSAPAVTGTDSNTGITFPAADTIKFSTGGVERISITNSGISGTGISAGGKFSSYAFIKDTKGNTTDGGTFTSGAWRTRDLNAEISDEDGIVSISSNQFTLAAGNYLIKFQAPALKVEFHQARLRNNTDGINYSGTSEYSGSGDVVQTVSFGVARVAITGSKAFEIQHRSTATKTTDGFGQPSYGFGDESIYTLVEIFKES